MATGLGLRVGTYESVAAVVTDADDSAPEYIVRDTVLHMTADGSTTLGGDPPEGTAHTVTDFLAKVGDPGGVVVADSAYRPEDLVATALFGLIEASAQHLSPPTEIIATHPANWNSDVVTALRDALDYLGLRSVQLMPETTTAVAVSEQPRSETRQEPAYGAAVVALAAAGGAAATTEIPVPAGASLAGPMVIAPAYSALADPPTPLPPMTAPTKPASRVGRFKETPVLVAAGAAAFVALVSGIAAAALGGAPAETAAQRSAATSTAESAVPVAPVVPVQQAETVAAPESVAHAPVVEQIVAPEIPVEVAVTPVEVAAPAPEVIVTPSAVVPPQQTVPAAPVETFDPLAGVPGFEKVTPYPGAPGHYEFNPFYQYGPDGPPFPFRDRTVTEYPGYLVPLAPEGDATYGVPTR